MLKQDYTNWREKIGSASKSDKVVMMEAWRKRQYNVRMLRLMQTPWAKRITGELT